MGDWTIIGLLCLLIILVISELCHYFIKACKVEQSLVSRMIKFSISLAGAIFVIVICINIIVDVMLSTISF